MKISYLPEVTSPTGTTVFPIAISGETRKAALSQLETFSETGTVGFIFAGENIKLTPNPIVDTGSVNLFLPGTIWAFGGQAGQTPTGWLACGGQQVSRVLYKNLFDVIGISYGQGNGSTTFNVPDLKERCIVGWETMGGVASSGRTTNTRPGNLNTTQLGTVGGSSTHTLSPEETSINTHRHNWTNISLTFGGGNEDGNKCNGGSGGARGVFPGSYTEYWNYTFTTNATALTSATSHPNLPPLVILNWAIKY